MILASFGIAVLAGMGVGSGGLFILYLTMLADMPQLQAQGLNLYFFIFATAAALLLHAKAQPLPLWRLVYICLVGSVGCILGALLAQRMDGGMLRTVFAILLIVTGTITLFARDSEKNEKFQKTIYK